MVRDHLIRWEIIEIVRWLTIHRTGTTSCDGRLETPRLLIQHWPTPRMARAEDLRSLPANPSQTIHRIKSGLTRSTSQLIAFKGGMALQNPLTGLLCCIIPSLGTHESCQMADPGPFMTFASEGCHGSASRFSTARVKALKIHLPLSHGVITGP